MNLFDAFLVFTLGEDEELNHTSVSSILIDNNDNISVILKECSKLIFSRPIVNWERNVEEKEFIQSITKLINKGNIEILFISNRHLDDYYDEKLKSSDWNENKEFMEIMNDETVNKSMKSIDSSLNSFHSFIRITNDSGKTFGYSRKSYIELTDDDMREKLENSILNSKHLNKENLKNKKCFVSIQYVLISFLPIQLNGIAEILLRNVDNIDLLQSILNQSISIDREEIIQSNFLQIPFNVSSLDENVPLILPMKMMMTFNENYYRLFIDFPNLSSIDFSLILQFFKINDIIRIVVCLLLEYDIILQSNHIHLLYDISSTFIQLLLPFQWSFSYIPIFPGTFEQLSTYMTAPTPFILGTTSPELCCRLISNRSVKSNDDEFSLNDERSKRCIVFIDDGIIQVIGKQLPSFPNHTSLQLELHLLLHRFNSISPELFNLKKFRDYQSTNNNNNNNNNKHKRINLNKENYLINLKFNLCFREIFFHRHVLLFHNYQEILSVNSSMSSNNHSIRPFHPDEFMSNQPTKFRSFLKEFLKTQCFINFIDAHLFLLSTTINEIKINNLTSMQRYLYSFSPLFVLFHRRIHLWKICRKNMSMNNHTVQSSISSATSSISNSSILIESIHNGSTNDNLMELYHKYNETKIVNEEILKDFLPIQYVQEIMNNIKSLNEIPIKHQLDLTKLPRYDFQNNKPNHRIRQPSIDDLEDWTSSDHFQFNEHFHSLLKRWNHINTIDPWNQSILKRSDDYGQFIDGFLPETYSIYIHLYQSSLISNRPSFRSYQIKRKDLSKNNDKQTNKLTMNRKRNERSSSSQQSGQNYSEKLPINSQQKNPSNLSSIQKTDEEKKEEIASLSLIRQLKEITVKLIIAKCSDVKHEFQKRSGKEENELIVSLCDIIDQIWRNEINRTREEENGNCPLWEHINDYHILELHSRTHFQYIDQSRTNKALMWALNHKKMRWKKLVESRQSKLNQSDSMIDGNHIEHNSIDLKINKSNALIEFDRFAYKDNQSKLLKEFHKIRRLFLNQKKKVEDETRKGENEFKSNSLLTFEKRHNNTKRSTNRYVSLTPTHRRDSSFISIFREFGKNILSTASQHISTIDIVSDTQEELEAKQNGRQPRTLHRSAQHLYEKKKNDDEKEINSIYNTINNGCTLTPKGMERAFIRYCIEKKCLKEILCDLLKDKILLRSFFQQNAILRNLECVQQILEHLGTLSVIQTYCFTNNYSDIFIDYNLRLEFREQFLRINLFSFKINFIISGTFHSHQISVTMNDNDRKSFSHTNLGQLSNIVVSCQNDSTSKNLLSKLLRVHVENETMNSFYIFERVNKLQNDEMKEMDEIIFIPVDDNQLRTSGTSSQSTSSSSQQSTKSSTIPSVRHRKRSNVLNIDTKELSKSNGNSENKYSSLKDVQLNRESTSHPLIKRLYNSIEQLHQFSLKNENIYSEDVVQFFILHNNDSMGRILLKFLTDVVISVVLNDIHSHIDENLTEENEPSLVWKSICFLSTNELNHQNNINVRKLSFSNRNSTQTIDDLKKDIFHFHQSIHSVNEMVEKRSDIIFDNCQLEPFILWILFAFQNGKLGCWWSILCNCFFNLYKNQIRSTRYRSNRILFNDIHSALQKLDDYLIYKKIYLRHTQQLTYLFSQKVNCGK